MTAADPIAVAGDRPELPDEQGEYAACTGGYTYGYCIHAYADTPREAIDKAYRAASDWHGADMVRRSDFVVLPRGDARLRFAEFDPGGRAPTGGAR